MTTSHHVSTPAMLASAVLVLLLGGAAAAEDHEKQDAAEQDRIDVVSTNVQGKNVYIPSTIVVEKGRPQLLSVYNTTDTPHGFAIAELGIQEVLLPNEEHRVELPALEGGKVYRIHCQLHPPHRNATLVVLP